MCMLDKLGEAAFSHRDDPTALADNSHARGVGARTPHRSERGRFRCSAFAV